MGQVVQAAAIIGVELSEGSTRFTSIPARHDRQEQVKERSGDHQEAPRGYWKHAQRNQGSYADARADAGEVNVNETR